MEGLVIVFRASGMSEAELVKGYLESEDIPVVLDYESAGRVYGLTLNGLGEVRLRVPEEFAVEARAALARRPGALKVLLSRYPDPDSPNGAKSRPFPGTAVANESDGADPDAADPETADPDVA